MSEWRSGGYFLVGPVKEGVVKDGRLPSVLWSASTCVSDSYPDESYLDWVASTPEKEAELRKALDLSDEALGELKAHATELFSADLVRWPNVLASLAVARDLYRRWFRNLAGLRLIGVALRSRDVPGFLAAIRAHSNPHDGVASLLGEDRPPGGGEAWGFEVLGYDFGLFHTYLCHGLEAELMDVLGVRFNERGLIGAWSDAVKVSEWINRDEVGAEPVPWFPWRIDGYPLE